MLNTKSITWRKLSRAPLQKVNDRPVLLPEPEGGFESLRHHILHAVTCVSTQNSYHEEHEELRQVRSNTTCNDDPGKAGGWPHEKRKRKEEEPVGNGLLKWELRGWQGTPARS